MKHWSHLFKIAFSEIIFYIAGADLPDKFTRPFIREKVEHYNHYLKGEDKCTVSANLPLPSEFF